MSLKIMGVVNKDWALYYHKGTLRLADFTESSEDKLLLQSFHS